MGFGLDFDLKAHVGAFHYTMVSRSYCHYFGRLCEVVPAFVKVLVTWCKKTIMMQKGLMIFYPDFAYLEPMRVLQATLWGLSLILAEVKFLYDYDSGIRHTNAMVYRQSCWPSKSTEE